MIDEGHGGITAACPLHVLDVGTQVAGPFAATLLGDFGADVIKCEQPGSGDPIRLADGLSARWQVEGRNKRSITLNLRDSEGQGIFRRLAAWADVLVENFRPGTMEHWGLGYEELKRENERLVYVSVSGFGQTGPRRSHPGYDSIGAAFGGLMAATSGTDGSPVAPGLFVVDYMTGMLAAVGALEAVRRRDGPGGTGRGEWVDAALYESVLRLAATGIVEHSEGTGAPRSTRQRVFLTQDGHWVCIFPVSTPQYDRLRSLIDPNVAVEVNGTGFTDLLANWAVKQDRAKLLESLYAADVPASPVNDIADLIADDHVAARGALTTVMNARGALVTMPAPTPRLGHDGSPIRWAGEPLGASNDAIYEGLLGMTKDDCDVLRTRGVI